MNVQTKMSEKGQVVIPKDVRDSLDLVPGQRFTVLRAGGDIILRPTDRDRSIGFDAAVAALRACVRYDGPMIPVEQLGWSPDMDDADEDDA